MANTIDPNLDTPKLHGQVAAMHTCLKILVSALRVTSADHEKVLQDLFPGAVRTGYAGLSDDAQKSYRDFLEELSKGLRAG